MSEAKLTKKQKKAQAFKSKKKGARDGDEQLDVPERDDLDLDEAAEAAAPAVAEKSKKRKRDADGADDTVVKKGKQKALQETETEEQGAGDEPPKKKKRQRGGKSAGKKRMNHAAERRLLLFVGNLSDASTTETVEAHFTPCGEKPIVRLRQSKKDPTPQQKRTARFAFVEFASANAVREALKLHRSTLDGKSINVELTAGGGGNSDARKAKIQDGRKRLEEQRGRAKDKPAGAGEEGEGEAPIKKWADLPQVEGAKPAAAAVEKEESKTRVVVHSDGTKTRIRKREPKLGADGLPKERARKAVAKSRSATGANSITIG